MLMIGEFGSGQVLWSILWFFLFVLWFSLLISIFGDIFRAHSMSGWAKATWGFGVLFLPILGVLLYLIVNGDDMNRRNEEDRQAANEWTRAYVRQTVGSGTSATEELRKLAELHESGALSDVEYQQAKGQIAPEED